MDYIRKGHERGEARHSAKLTEADVREIVRLLSTPCPCCGRLPSQRSMASRFGVSPPLICNIVNGKDWKHVTGGATPHPTEGAI